MATTCPAWASKEMSLQRVDAARVAEVDVLEGDVARGPGRWRRRPGASLISGSVSSRSKAICRVMNISWSEPIVVLMVSSGL